MSFLTLIMASARIILLPTVVALVAAAKISQKKEESEVEGHHVNKY